MHFDRLIQLVSQTIRAAFPSPVNIVHARGNRYTDIFVGQPQVEEDYITRGITPQACRLRDMTYAAPISVDVEYTRGKEIVVRKGKSGVGAVVIGRMPLMLRSDRCSSPLASGFCMDSVE